MSDPTETTETNETPLREWVIAAQTGDADAFGVLVARFQSMAVAVAMGMLGDAHLAQDAAQEAFIDAYLSLNTLRDPAAFPGWFRRIVFKHADRQLRAGRREWPMDEARDVADGLSQSEHLEAIYTRQRVHDALDELPDRQQRLASLFYFDGYSQQDLADFLNVPLPSVKKGLFLARKRLREEMQDMAETMRPQTDDLATKTQFFIALHQHDVAKVKALLKQAPGLMDARTEWGLLPNSNYWPLGYTALHWAAATDDAPLLDALIDGVIAAGADVNVRTKNWKATALHVAAMMRRPNMTQRLLAAGANAGAADESGHTPLHIAAYYGDTESMKALLDAGAAPHIKDSGGRTALDWAIHKGHDEAAALLKGKGAQSTQATPQRATPNTSTPILETGLKLIDFFAPMKRGGVNALFTPKSGVGKVVTIEYLMQMVAEHYGGHSIFLGVEHENYTMPDMALEFHETGLTDAVTLLYARDGDANSFKKAAQSAINTAKSLGKPALVFADVAFANHGAQADLESVTGGANSITLIWYGDYTAGAEPENFAKLESLVTFEVWRAYQGLWPSIDPLHSRSMLVLDEWHARLQAQARRLLRRFEDLRTIVDKDPRGLAALATDDDRRDVERGRKLHAFMSQPLPVAELYTNLIGEYVPLRQTLDGVEAILNGNADDVAEDKLRFIGLIDRAIRR